MKTTPGWHHRQLTGSLWGKAVFKDVGGHEEGDESEEDEGEENEVKTTLAAAVAHRTTPVSRGGCVEKDHPSLGVPPPHPATQQNNHSCLGEPISHNRGKCHPDLDEPLWSDYSK